MGKNCQYLNRKAQMDIYTFIVVVVALLILAPIMLKVVNSVLGGFSTAINSTSQVASENVDYIQTSFVTFWDWLIAIAFLVNIIMLFVYAFLTDTHPVFALFYLIGVVITLMFAHYVIVPIETIFGMSQFSTEVIQLPITGFILQTFDLILLGIIIVTGIITYGKFKGSGGITR